MRRSNPVRLDASEIKVIQISRAFCSYGAFLAVDAIID